MKERIVIANASGFWGDEAAAVKRQVLGGPIDYLTMDYLAEITMIILARQRAKRPAAGYAQDFVEALTGVLEEIKRRGITVIANAGGMNPAGCADALRAVTADKGLDLPVAVVDGDDLMPRLADLAAEGCTFDHLNTGEPLTPLLDRVTSANAYLGARPIVAALEQGARIVVTGRTYDAASVLAPFVYEFGWSWQDWDRLAAALLAGHLIECGTQSTGGNYTFWRDVPDFKNMGYPLVEARPDGGFVLTKHPGTGGRVTRRTVTEQLLYEIGDPRCYHCPDVTADFTSFELADDGPDRVRVSGGRGRPPSDRLKVSINHEAGFKTVAMLVVSGPDAVAKGRTLAGMFWERVGTERFTATRTDFVGHSACWGASAAPETAPNEIILRFAARADDPAPLGRMAREVAGLILAGPPGVTVFGGRPPVTPAYGFWPGLIERRHVTARLVLGGSERFFPCDTGPTAEPAAPPEGDPPITFGGGARVTVPLSRVAHARAGDKGDLANIGVAALTPALYPELLREVTPERVAAFFADNVRGPVERFHLDNLYAVNFVLHGALDGGGTVSLLLDPQGKTLAQALLTMEVTVAEDLVPDGGNRWGRCCVVA